MKDGIKNFKNYSPNIQEELDKKIREYEEMTTSASQELVQDTLHSYISHFCENIGNRILEHEFNNVAEVFEFMTQYMHGYADAYLEGFYKLNKRWEDEIRLLKKSRFLVIKPESNNYKEV